MFIQVHKEESISTSAMSPVRTNWLSREEQLQVKLKVTQIIGLNKKSALNPANTSILSAVRNIYSVKTFF